MRNLAFKKASLLFGFAALATAPVFVVVACGESGQAEITAAQVASIKVDSASTHDAVTWVKDDITEKMATKQYHLSDTPLSLTEAMHLNDTDWAAQAPSTIDYSNEKRFLWVKIMPTADYKITNNFVDLTQSSGIKEVKSKVDTLPGFNNISLDKIVVNVVPASTTFYEVNDVELPITDAKVIYDYENNKSLTKTNLLEILKSQKPTKEAIDSKLTARLAPIDDARFVVATDRKSKPTVYQPTIKSRISDSDLAKITNVQVRINSEANNENIVWTGVDSSLESNEVKDFEFLVGNYVDESDVANAPQNAWKKATDLPTKIDYTHNKRYVWARVIAKPEVYFENIYTNLSTSSRVGSVPSVFDTTKLDFTNTKITLKTDESQEVVAVPALPNEIASAFEYKFRVGATDTLYTQTELLAYLKALTSRQNYIGAGVTAELTPKTASASQFVLKPTLASKVKTEVAEKYYFDATELGSDSAILNGMRVSASSTHNNVSWQSKQTFTNLISSAKYLVGNYSSIEEVKTVPASEWVNTLPSSLNYNHNERHLWAEVALSSGNYLRNKYYDLTSISQIQSVKTLINLDPLSETINSNKFYLQGNEFFPNITKTTNELPINTRYLYQLDPATNSAWITEEQLLAEIAKINEKFTLDQAQKIRVSIAPSDPIKYIVIASKMWSLTLDGAGDKLKAFNLGYRTMIDVATALNGTITVDLTKTETNRQVFWNDFKLAQAFKKITFATGYQGANPITITENMATQTALPTSVGLHYNKRYLWAKVEMTGGYAASNNTTFVDLTASSGITQVKGAIDDLDAYKNLDLSKAVTLVVAGSGAVGGGHSVSVKITDGMDVTLGGLTNYKITTVSFDSGAAKRYYEPTKLEYFFYGGIGYSTEWKDYVKSTKVYLTINDPAHYTLADKTVDKYIKLAFVTISDLSTP